MSNYLPFIRLPLANAKHYCRNSGPRAEITQPTNSQGQVSKLAGHLARQRAD